MQLNIKNQSTFYQKFYAMTVWVQYLQPSTFCLQAKHNNQLILRHVIELRLSEACRAN